MKSPYCSADISHLAQRVGQLLLQRGAKITTAESCTGGGIAQAITQVPGSSQWFDCGYISYSNQAKQDLLAVEPEVLQQFGAVSEQVVEQMARGAIQVCRADYAIAVSGIAGPDGGTTDKPVGTVWLCWAGPLKTLSKKYQFEGDRLAVREQAIKISLQELLHQINE